MRKTFLKGFWVPKISFSSWLSSIYRKETKVCYRLLNPAAETPHLKRNWFRLENCKTRLNWKNKFAPPQPSFTRVPNPANESLKNVMQLRLCSLPPLRLLNLAHLKRAGVGRSSSSVPPLSLPKKVFLKWKWKMKLEQPFHCWNKLRLFWQMDHKRDFADPWMSRRGVPRYSRPGPAPATVH